ncbi:serine hydrolase domain-containing protein [Taibaiella helva]|uniref:serine hydrolase domain-containing protein n=1 Tax=Taibaiella helva TaxID=2301235 RepID=UPI000E58B875|nr:serine hydrolase domain-containing protein [Taibaiella helva]
MKPVFFFLFVFFSVYNLHAQKKAAEIDSLMQRAFRAGLFNGNVLVADRGKVIYKAAIGFADGARTLKLTEQYRFHIGSIAKEFNAVGMMLLQEQGKVRLEDKVAAYLPQLPSWADSIRVRDLLGYTSGLPDVRWTQVHSDADNLHDLLQLKQLDFPPGTRYAYNNNNVFLQRRIIEKITGLSFRDFVAQQLLKPLGIRNAIMDPAASDPLVAHSFDNNGKEDDLSVPISGWLAVNLDDFYCWAESIVNGKLISPASTRFLLLPYPPSRQSGLGFNGEMKGDQIVNFIHDGSARNYQALLVCRPQEGRTIILMTNNRQDNLGDFHRAIQDILDGKPYLQPKKPVFPLLQSQVDSLDGEQILSLYRRLEKKYNADYAFDNEYTLNNLGYYLLGKKRVADAIVILAYNTKLFPHSGNVFDSLGEAYYTKGDKQNALLNYKRSLALDPANTAAKKIIAELER